MERLTDMLARPSAWAGLVGLLLLIAALGWAGYERLVPARAAGCPALPTAGPTDHLRILDIGSPELKLRGSLCLIVDNVVPAAKLRAAQAAVRTAEREVAQLAPAAAPAPAKPALVRRYIPRLGRFAYVPATPAVPSAPAATPEQRTAAAARLTAARNDLSQLTGDRRIVLFLNGERAPVEPRTVAGQARPQRVIFSLRPDDSAVGEGSAFWRTLLGGRTDRGRVPVSVGVAEEGAARPADTPLRATPARNGGTSVPLGFRVFHPAIVALAAAGLVLLLAGIAGYARTTALFRDGRSRYSQYSLGRIQMAWWLALALGGFVYIWLVTGQYLDVVGSATFALLGIAGATAGAARVVEQPRTGAEPLTRGFFADISGGERVELHRLQMIAWTLVLGAIYAWNVLINFRLTDFDGNLLALAGVVNGVYVGLKTQEA